ncbi:jg20086 [Pararge aegeria aegeria]|uniref:Jg20086 protein n=4 Tax=Pararge aegeria TaxID=116150 RepID=A0A8S4S7F4_9NEOP|nr:jg20086 [Pararge aegeria aegeria]
MPTENAYGELRAPPLPPRKSLSPAETIVAASSVQDIAAASSIMEPRRRSSLEPEPDSRHRLTSVITGSTETITGLIDTRHEVPPDPRAFEKPRRACTPQSNSRPLPAPPPERLTEPKPEKQDQKLPERHIERQPDNRIPDRLPERHIERPIDNRLPTERQQDNRLLERHIDRHQDIRLLERVIERQPDNRLPERHIDNRLTERQPDNRLPERHIDRQLDIKPPERHERQENRQINDRLISLDKERHSENRTQFEKIENRTDRSNSENRILERQAERYVQDTRNIDFRNPPERPDKPDRDRMQSSDRSSFDRDTRVENRAPPRQRSLPSTTSGSMDSQPTKSTTMPKFPSEDVKDPPYENVGVEKNELAVAPKKINPLTHDKHGRKYCDNVSYENINLDYIARLVGEGYPKDIVVRALGITRNDLEMACDILHEFGCKVQHKC